MNAMEFIQIMCEKAKRIQENQCQLDQIKIILDKLKAGLPQKKRQQSSYQRQRKWPPQCSLSQRPRGQPQ